MVSKKFTVSQVYVPEGGTWKDSKSFSYSLEPIEATLSKSEFARYLGHLKKILEGTSESLRDLRSEGKEAYEEGSGYLSYLASCARAALTSAKRASSNGDGTVTFTIPPKSWDRFDWLVDEFPSLRYNLEMRSF